MTEHDLVSIYAQCLTSLQTLTDDLGPADWQQTTACPLWTVADVYAHVVGVEAWLARGAHPFTTPLQQFVDEHVESRRTQDPADVRTEFHRVAQQRLRQLPTEAQHPTAFIALSGKPGPTELGMRLRIFDLWTHEQDIRHALGRPGRLDTSAALVVRDMLLSSLPKITARALPPNTGVRFTVTGPVPFDATVMIDQSGKAIAAAEPSPNSVDVHVTLTWEGFTRLSAGRGAPAEYAVGIRGNQTLADIVLARLAVTP